jgi:hypothetical protein
MLSLNMGKLRYLRRLYDHPASLVGLICDSALVLLSVVACYLVSKNPTIRIELVVLSLMFSFTTIFGLIHNKKISADSLTSWSVLIAISIAFMLIAMRITPAYWFFFIAALRHPRHISIENWFQLSGGLFVTIGAMMLGGSIFGFIRYMLVKFTRYLEDLCKKQSN